MTILFDSIFGKFNNKKDTCDKDISEDVLKEILQEVSKSLVSVKFINHDDIAAEKPFALNIIINSSSRFMEYLFCYGVVFEMTHEDIFKMLSKKKNLLEESHIPNDDTDDILEDAARLINSVFKYFQDKKDNGKEKDICHMLNHISEAVSSVGKMPIEEFLIKYDRLIESMYGCKVIRGTKYAVNCKEVISGFNPSDYDILSVFMEHLLLDEGSFSQAFVNSACRKEFSENATRCISRVGKHLAISFYNSLDEVKKSYYIDYFRKFAIFKYTFENDGVYLIKTKSESDYRIEYYIDIKSSGKTYFFEVLIINEYLTKRIGTSHIDAILCNVVKELSFINCFKISGNAVKTSDDNIRSGVVDILHDYDSELISEFVDRCLSNYIGDQKKIIYDFVKEKVTKEVAEGEQE